MSKILVVLLAFAGLVPAGFWYASQTSDAEWGSLEQQKDNLEQRFENVKRFRGEMDRILGEIADENLPLAQAISQIEDAALLYHPLYKEKLFLAGNGKSYRVQIAHNILQYLDDVADTTGADLSEPRARVHQELREVCCAAGETPGIE